MEPSSTEQPKFNIQPIIEQRPFENPVVRSFFQKWCEINDSIKPQVIHRYVWELKNSVNSILENGPDGKKIIYLPKDLQLFEMVGVMEVIDHDTFITKPEQQNKHKDELIALGKLFKSSGIYIAKRLDSITEGKEIASALAEEFYDYGLSLENGKKPEKPSTVNDITSQNLTPKYTEVVDCFLAGNNLYQSRIARTKPELIESERQRTLSQFFKITQKAFELKQKTENNELKISKTKSKPWIDKTPIHSAFLAKIEQAITKKIETPKQELTSTIFRRGLEKLLEINLPNEQKRLIDELNLSYLKKELDKLRQEGDKSKISAKERKIADQIQRAIILLFKYKLDSDNPRDILKNKFINCLGASMLGGTLMQEVGLNYLVADIPLHSLLLLVTADNQVEWRDMLDLTLNIDLSNEVITGTNQKGLPLTVADIVAFSHNPNIDSLIFDINSPTFKENYTLEDWQKPLIIIHKPEYGQKIQKLLNIAGKNYITSNSTLHKEAIEILHQVTTIEPNNPYANYYLGQLLASLSSNFYPDAIKAFQKSININPLDISSYNELGNVYFELKLYDEALECYQQSTNISPKYAPTYLGIGDVFLQLQQYPQAIEAYQKFINLADKKEFKDLILVTQNKINKLTLLNEQVLS